MNDNSNIPNQPDWEKLLDFLEQEDQDETTLNTVERKQLAELKKIIAETSEALSSSHLFDSKQKWDTVKERLVIKKQSGEQLQDNQSKGEEIKRIKLWPRFIAIAAAVAFTIIGIQFFKTHNQKQRDPASIYADILPGRNGATIMFANGKVIQLSDAKSGVVVGKDLKYDDGTAISDSHPEFISEPAPTGREPRTIQTLIASTARGQTYQFTLPDGTKVWLNADSKISFPSQFSGEERKILLEGEGYFEVVHNAKQPFRVESKGQTVEVLGTHFNINAYKDEGVITTTLLEGSVRIAAFNSALGRENLMLKPNQQSILNSTGAQVLNVNAEDAIDWKNNEFVFHNEPLQDVMRKVSRWYDVTIVYKDQQLRPATFNGSVSRFDKVSSVLSMLEKTSDLQFEIKNKKIIVSNK